MRDRTSLMLLIVPLAVAGLLLVGDAAAGAKDHRVSCKATGQDYFDGTTTATITSGTLKGTAAGTYTRTPRWEKLDDIVGTITFTTGSGTVTVATVGTLDLHSLGFSLSATVTAGTGRYANATGDLLIWGYENLTTGSFTEDISGTLRY